MNSQDQWRYCEKCHGMFYDGYPEKGACPAGAGHNSSGFMFVLPHDLPPAPKYAVYGGIGDRYNALGGSTSWLGAATADEAPFAAGGRVSTFERGNIYWWPDTGAIELGNVAVRFKGLYCFSTTDGPGADEPYVGFGIAPAPPGIASSTRSPIYTDVDGGDSRPDCIELFRGLPYGLQLQCGLWEHDSGDQDRITGILKGIADTVAGSAKDACGDIGGPQVAEICEDTWDRTIKEKVGDLLEEIVNFIFGDVQIATWAWTISAKDMVRFAQATPTNFWGNIYHLESPLLQGSGADYKVYLDVIPV